MTRSIASRFPVVGIALLAICSSLGSASDYEILALNASAPILLGSLCLDRDGSIGAACAPLSRGPGSFTNCPSTKHQDCCFHTCRQGYIPIGNGESQCINGNWTGDNTFKCQLNSTWCSGPSLDNAASTVCDKNTAREHLTLCRFECLPGYIASTSGAIERQCKGGSWVGSDEPHCIAEPSEGPLTIGVLILVVLMGAFVLLGGFTCMKMRSQAQVPQIAQQSKVVSGGGGRSADIEAQPMSPRGGTYSRAHAEGATEGGPAAPLGATRRAPSRRVLRANDEAFADVDDNSELEMSDDDAAAGAVASGSRKRRKKGKSRRDEDVVSEDDQRERRKDKKKRKKDKDKDKDSKRKKKDRRSGKSRKDRDDDDADDDDEERSSDDGLDKEARRRRRKEKREARKRKHKKKKDRSSRASGGDDDGQGEGDVGHTGAAAPIPEAAPDAPLPAAAAVPPAYDPPPSYPVVPVPVPPVPAAADDGMASAEDEEPHQPAPAVVGPDGHVMVPAPPSKQIRQLKLKKKEVKQPKVLKLGSRKPPQPPSGLSLASGAHPAAGGRDGAVPQPSSPPPGVPAGLQLAPAPGAGAAGSSPPL